MNFRLDFDSTISSAKNVDAGCSFDPKPTENKKRKKKNKGKNKQEEDKEFKEVKYEEEAKKESVMEKKTEKEAKEIEDGATTDDMSLPAAKKPHLSQPEKSETPKAEFSGKKEVEQEPTRNENHELAKEEVKSKNWSEPQEVTTVEDSKSLVNRLCENPPDHISVCCVGENLGTESSKIRMIVISCHPESYVYHLKDETRGLVKDGLLEKLLLDKTITKVYHDIGPVSASLIHEYDILMDGIPIWDISILFGKICLSQMDTDELGVSNKGPFKKWTKQNEDYGKAVSSSYDPDIVGMLYERGKLISDLYRACIKKTDEIVWKTVKKEVFQAAIPSNETFLAEKVKQLKLEKKEKKQAEKPQAAAPQQSQQQQKQQGKSSKGKQGKGRKK
ncbi:uncharacterized protein LOC132715760 [Ruditapes philippinarum]|uniref:uncharacterized protein LOC132715760 n=1 Tax=Ruditapes philippinarum TaxID=129788 RepID=UPI00295BEE8B|nr:uncharacterized protein LOC132715760 [Ruditapes philippinarum]